MEARTKKTLVLLTLLITTAAAAFPLDVGAEFWLGNLGFRADRASTDTAFPGADFLWGASLYAIQPLGDTIKFEGGFYSDLILRNISYTLLSYTEKIVTVGVGPFFGFFNDKSILLKPGISTAVKLEIPGALFVSFRSDSTIGGVLLEKGDYLQERSDISLGFYVKNVICTLSLDTKKFTQVQDAATTVDALTQYALGTDIFQKNVPYRFELTFAYQSLSKTFIAPAGTVKDTVGSIVIGTKLDFTISNSLVLYADLEGSVYSFGQDQLVGGTMGGFLFRASTGFRLNLDTLTGITKLY